jgi:hypothetical protein
MRLIFLLAAAGLALSGCAMFDKDAAPVCDGKDRRPANVHGSVLSAALPPERLAANSTLFGSCRA